MGNTLGPVTSTLAVILFTDIENSTGLKDCGFARWYGALKRHNELFDATIANFADSKKIKHTGDGYLATFRLPSEAVLFALRFQMALNLEPWESDLVIRARVGIHLGQVADINQAEQADVIGRTVDQTARIMSIAIAGQVLLTRSIFDSAKEMLPTGSKVESGIVNWAGHGEWELKGIEGPVEVYEVGLTGISPFRSPLSSEKGWPRHERPDPALLAWRAEPGKPVPSRPEWTTDRRLGIGGLGEVWLCRRGALRHAFKFFTDPRSKEALAIEADVQGRLNQLGRPEISQVVDINLARLPYYLESDYAEGGDLTQWVNAAGGIACIALASRLKLVADVADAVAAAHRIGIIHADIKPSNVLMQAVAAPPKKVVDRLAPAVPVLPRLADFGTRRALLARGVALPPSSAMTSAAEVNTEAYIAPEIRDGEPYTTRSDVYALGVLLYQMIVGDFRAAPDQDLPARIADPLLRKDVADCIRQNANDRPSASAVADRLRRLAVRRTSAWRRQWGRRAAVAVVAVTLSTAVGTAYLSIRGFFNQKDTAIASTKFMADLFDSLDADAQPTDPAISPLMVLCERAREQLNKGSLNDYPQARATVAQSIGNGFRSMQSRDKAEEMFRQSLAAIDGDGNDRLDARLPAEIGLINVLMDLATLKTINEADERFNKVRRGYDDVTVADSLRADMLQTEARLARAHNDSPANAAKLFGKAAELLAATQSRPATPIQKSRIFRIRIRQADMQLIAGQNADALVTLDAATRNFNPTEYKDPIAEADYRLVKGKTLIRLQRYAEAIRELTSAVELRRATIGASKLDTIWAEHELADAFEKAGEYGRAAELRKNIFDWSNKTDVPQSLRVSFQACWALVYNKVNPVDARPSLQDALAKMRSRKLEELSDQDQLLIQRICDALPTS